MQNDARARGGSGLAAERHTAYGDVLDLAGPALTGTGEGHSEIEGLPRKSPAFARLCRRARSRRRACGHAGQTVRQIIPKPGDVLRARLLVARPECAVTVRSGEVRIFGNDHGADGALLGKRDRRGGCHVAARRHAVDDENEWQALDVDLADDAVDPGEIFLFGPHDDQRQVGNRQCFLKHGPLIRLGRIDHDQARACRLELLEFCCGAGIVPSFGDRSGSASPVRPSPQVRGGIGIQHNRRPGSGLFGPDCQPAGEHGAAHRMTWCGKNEYLHGERSTAAGNRTTA